MKPYKTCSCCFKQYMTKKEFISKCEFVGNWDEFGLVLYNCSCKSTLSIEKYKGSKLVALQNRRLK